MTLPLPVHVNPVLIFLHSLHQALPADFLSFPFLSFSLNCTHSHTCTRCMACSSSIKLQIDFSNHIRDCVAQHCTLVRVWGDFGTLMQSIPFCASSPLEIKNISEITTSSPILLSLNCFRLEILRTIFTFTFYQTLGTS